MRPEEVIELIDSSWFAMGAFQDKPITLFPASSEAKSDLDDEKDSSETEFKAFARIPTIHTRSMSDQLGSNLSFTESFSPGSDFYAPKLLPILSGKEITKEIPRMPSEIEEIEHKNKKKLISRRRAKKAASKSLSELEFEELKGFMDLGFVFTEEDNNDSRLVEIVPGLQRLGKKKEEEIKEGNGVVQEAGGVSRPYLSEAWKVMEERRRKEEAAAPLMMMKWKIPDLSNENGMKNSLKWWAHTVASTVR